jgi:hypothetical protein
MIRRPTTAPYSLYDVFQILHAQSDVRWIYPVDCPISSGRWLSSHKYVHDTPSNCTLLLTFCLQNNHAGLQKWFSSTPSDVSIKWFSKHISALLTAAALCGHLECVEMLLDTAILHEYKHLWQIASFTASYANHAHIMQFISQQQRDQPLVLALLKLTMIEGACAANRPEVAHELLKSYVAAPQRLTMRHLFQLRKMVKNCGVWACRYNSEALFKFVFDTLMPHVCRLDDIGVIACLEASLEVDNFIGVKYITDLPENDTLRAYLIGRYGFKRYSSCLPEIYEQFEGIKPVPCRLHNPYMEDRRRNNILLYILHGLCHHADLETIQAFMCRFCISPDRSVFETVATRGHVPLMKYLRALTQDRYPNLLEKALHSPQGSVEMVQYLFDDYEPPTGSQYLAGLSTQFLIQNPAIWEWYVSHLTPDVAFYRHWLRRFITQECVPMIRWFVEHASNVLFHPLFSACCRDSHDVLGLLELGANPQWFEWFSDTVLNIQRGRLHQKRLLVNCLCRVLPAHLVSHLVISYAGWL